MNDYHQNGFVKFSNFLTFTERKILISIIEDFHQSWLNANQAFYNERAINSAYLTSPKHLPEQQRFELFDFISSDKLVSLADKLCKTEPVFMGTQLFFNPANPKQKNYWHRDAQYHLNEAEQKEALKGPEVLHFRLALKDEPGIEVIPNSHRQWDTEEELAVRLEKDGHKNHENLRHGHAIELKAGDLLVFSANMIHRGLYGKDRLAFDILFCENEPQITSFQQKNCMPTSEQLARLKNNHVFLQ